MVIGAGRDVPSMSSRIAGSINDGSFREIATLSEALRRAADGSTSLHLVGMIGGPDERSSADVAIEVLRSAKAVGVGSASLHCILDAVPDAAERLEEFRGELEKVGLGEIATVCGRHFAMDSAGNWDRTARAFTMIAFGEGEAAEDAIAAVRAHSGRGISGEFIAPIVVGGTLSDGDTVIFLNHRADEMRQLVRSLAIPESGGAEGAKPKIEAICMTEYDRDFGLPMLFPPIDNENTLTRVLTEAGVPVIQIAEPGRFAHATLFIDGGTIFEHPLKTKIAVPYNAPAGGVEPEMGSFKTADAVIRAVEESAARGMFIVSFAAPGMIEELGNDDRTVEAFQFVDTCIGGIAEAVKAAAGSAAIVAATADGDVPFLLIAEGPGLESTGTLADVAPTVLGHLGFDVPAEMTGSDLRKG